jgi:hypothetical protein
MIPRQAEPIHFQEQSLVSFMSWIIPMKWFEGRGVEARE